MASSDSSPLSTLPPEIKIRIISFLHNVRLAPLAAVSRSWQPLVEARTFATLRVRSTELDVFAKCAVGIRRRAVRVLCYKIAPVGAEELQLDDAEKSNETFTREVGALSEVLRRWNEEEEGTCALSVELSTNSLSLEPHLEERLRNHSVKIIGGNGMPEVKVVRRLSVGPLDPPRIDGPSIAKIAGRLTALEELNADVYDNDRIYPDLRRAHRIAFAAALSATSFPALRTLRLTFDHWPPGNHSVRPASMMSSTPHNHDPFSLALRRLASSAPNLIRLNLGSDSGVSITPSAFWPALNEVDTSPPCWPHLRHLDVLLSSVGADGSWLYHDPERSGEESEGGAAASDHSTPAASNGGDFSGVDDDWADEVWDASVFPTPSHHRHALATGDWPLDSWRTKPHLPTIRRLFVAAARAAGRMPELRTMNIRAGQVEDVPCRMGFAAEGEDGWLGYVPAWGDVQRAEEEKGEESRSAVRAGMVVPEGIDVGQELETVWKESKGEELKWRVGRREWEQR